MIPSVIYLVLFFFLAVIMFVSCAYQNSKKAAPLQIVWKMVYGLEKSHHSYKT